MNTSDRLTISVAMCTRNGERFVQQQLESILQQQPRPDEIVVSDDDSSDRTVGIVRTVLGRHPNVESRVLVNSPPLGLVANFQATTVACTSDLVALSDQDDVWTEGRLDRLRSMLEVDPTLTLISSDARLIDENDRPIGPSLFDALEVTAAEKADMTAGRSYARLLRRNLVTGATVVFRRSLLDVAVPFPDGWVHDEWLAILAAATGSVTLVNDPLVDYRQHSANEIGAFRPTTRDKLARLTIGRAERNARLLLRATVLVDRLRTIQNLRPGVLAAAEGKLRHEQMRSGLPASRLRRIGPVLSAVGHGQYRLYSRGRRDILRDLVQPS